MLKSSLQLPILSRLAPFQNLEDSTFLLQYLCCSSMLSTNHITLLELLWHLAMYLGVVLLHTRTTAPTYKRTFRKSSNIPLVTHIVSGLSEVFRYQVRRVLAGGPPVTPDGIDLVLALAHSWSVMVMAKTLLRGHRSFTRPSYQAGAVLRTVASMMAFGMGSPEMHRGSVKIINGFIYTRAIIFIAYRLKLTHCYSTLYAAAVFLAGLLATYESGLPAALPAYMAVTVGLLQFNRAVSAEIGSTPIPTAKHEIRSRILRGLVGAGLAELDTIKATENSAAIEPSIQDEYIEPVTTSKCTKIRPSSTLITEKVWRTQKSLFQTQREHAMKSVALGIRSAVDVARFRRPVGRVQGAAKHLQVTVAP